MLFQTSMTRIKDVRIFFLVCVLLTFLFMVLQVILGLHLRIRHEHANNKIIQVATVQRSMHYNKNQRNRPTTTRFTNFNARNDKILETTRGNISGNCSIHSTTRSIKTSPPTNYSTRAPIFAGTKKIFPTTTAEKNKKTPAETTQNFAGKVLWKSLKNEKKFIQNVNSYCNKLPPHSLHAGFLQRVIRKAKRRRKGWQSDEKQSVHDSQFLLYMKCPTSVRMKMVLEPTTKRFVAETPILAWDDHYSKDEYNRLSNFNGIFGWRNIKEKHIASALAALNSSHNRYMFDDRLVKGSILNDGKCIRCAVVGNGGVLNGSKKGKEIDANDYVFRVNTALTKGHEEDVGTRTSFYCFGLITFYNAISQRFTTEFYNPPSDKGIRYVFFADSEWTYSYLSAMLNRRRPPLRGTGKGWMMSPPQFPKQLTAKDVKLVHPDFERYLKLSWINSKDKNKPIHRPSTGAIMLLLALHTCDEVNAYGFGGSSVKYSDHYYDLAFSKRGNFANHDNIAESNLWKELHKRGIINLYTRE